MENSLLFIFGEIWPMTLYYSTGTLTPTCVCVCVPVQIEVTVRIKHVTFAR